MEKRILLPTDFSKNSLNAARYAIDLYRSQPCRFYMLNVYQVSGYSIDHMAVPEPGDSAYEAGRLASENGMEKFMLRLKLHGGHPDHQFETISSFNSLVYGVNHQIAQKDIDLVVMGTKGATDARSIIFGTNTVHVMELVTECPVLAIPAGYQFAPPKEIVFPTDYKIAFKRRELNSLLEIAGANNSVIHVLHIKKEAELNRIQEGHRQLLESILEGVAHEFHTLKGLKVHKGIGAFVTSRKSEMIAFMNQRHSFLGKILSKPLVNELGFHYKIPILEMNA